MAQPVSACRGPRRSPSRRSRLRRLLRLRWSIRRLRRRLRRHTRRSRIGRWHTGRWHTRRLRRSRRWRRGSRTGGISVRVGGITATETSLRVVAGTTLGGRRHLMRTRRPIRTCRRRRRLSATGVFGGFDGTPSVASDGSGPTADENSILLHPSPDHPKFHPGLPGLLTPPGGEYPPSGRVCSGVDGCAGVALG